MRSFLLILFFLIPLVFFTCLPAAAFDLRPFEDEAAGMWGYVDADTGRVVIPTAFLFADEFSDAGVAFAVAREGWVCINGQGEPLLRPFIFDNGPDYFQENLARFVQDGKMGYFNRACEVVIPAAYDFGLPFENGRAAVCMECYKEYAGEHYTVVGGRWGCIDREGKLVKPLVSSRGPVECTR